MSLSPEDLQDLITNGWRLTPATCAHKITGGRWIPAKHLLHLSNIIAREIRKGGARILVSMPPRHGKSEFLSVHTSTWHLEEWPELFVMLLSYGLDLSTDFSFRVRNHFTHEDYSHLLTTRIVPDRMRVERFVTTAGGGMTAAGIGGVITGRGAHLMLIDDYIKNAEDALSKNQRDKTWEWFKSTAYTRLEPGGNMVITATRWDLDDLIGRCLSEMPNENWIVIKLSAFAGKNDVLGRQVGEPLWPERYPVEELQKIKDALGTYWWEAMYQQNPLESMSDFQLGNMLKVIDIEDLPHPNNLKYVRSWDLASSEDKGDYTAGPKLAVHAKAGSDNIYILDMQHFREKPATTQDNIERTAMEDGNGVSIWMEQEPGSSGKTVIETYETKVLKGFSFRGEKPTGRIEVRAQPFLAAVERGNVFMVRAGWNEALRKEVNAFPMGDHDDQISALALGYHKLVRTKFKGVTWGRDSQMQDSISGLRSKHFGNLQKKANQRKGVTW